MMQVLTPNLPKVKDFISSTNGYKKQLLSYGSFPNYDFPFANATGGGITIGRIGRDLVT